MKVKAALLSLLMLLSLLLGCGSADPSASSAASPTVEVTYTPVPTDVPTPEPTAEPTAEPAAEPTAEPTADPIAYTLEDYYGFYYSGVYFNLPFDFAFVIPEDWGTDYEATMEEGSFYATSSSGDMAMSIEYMDAGQPVTEAFMDSLMNLLAAKWTTQMEELNVEISTMEVIVMELAGRSVPALYFEADQNGEHINFVNGYLSTDSYLLSVTVLTTEADPFGIATQTTRIPEEAKALLTLATTDSGTDTDNLEGYYEDSQYINPHFGLTVNLPEGWSFYDEASLAEQNGLDVSSMVGENWEELVRNSTSIILMGAQTADGLQSMNLTLTPVTNMQTEAMQRQALEASKEPLTNVYTGMGYTIDTMELDTVEVMGNVLPCLYVEMSVSGISVSEVLFILSTEDYIFNATFVTVGGNAYDLVSMLNPLS